MNEYAMPIAMNSDKQLIVGGKGRDVCPSGERIQNALNSGRQEGEFGALE
jgi:hypothetical protein